MRKGIKQFTMIFIFLALMIQITGVVSADGYTYSPSAFLEHLDNGTNFNDSVITLTSGIANASHEYIISSSNVTIIGDKTIFNGNTTDSHFKVTGNNVTLKGINFTNFKYNGDGGAIWWYMATDGVVDNCNFTNCQGLQGGAIRWDMSNYGTIFNSNFINCSSSYGGALFYWSDCGNITDCNFTNCTSLQSGGSIYMTGFGGAINNCNFNNVVAKSSGGAIYVPTSSYMIIENSKFKNCSAKIAGAIRFYGDYANIRNCDFIYCNSTSNSGAVRVYGGNINLYGCNFTYCHSNSTAGAIMWQSPNGHILNSNFVNCTSASSGGSVYCTISDNATIDRCIFINSTANGSGGALICYNSNNVNVTNCNFSICRSMNINLTTYAGAICWLGSPNGLVYNCTFLKCMARKGGAIAWMNYNDYISTNGKLVDNFFIDCSNVEYDGGIIYNAGTNFNVTGGTGVLIYNEGTLSNLVTATLISNETIRVAKNRTIVLDAILKIGDYTVGGSSFYFLVNDTASTLMEGNFNANGTYTCNYNADTLGKLLVSGKYDDAPVQYNTGMLDVKYEVFVSGDSISSKYNDTVTVKLNITSKDTDVTYGAVYILVDDKRFSGNVSNGTATINITSKIDSGNYIITAFYVENDEHFGATTDIFLSVTPINSLLMINSSDIDFGENVTLSIKTFNEMSGFIYIFANAKTFILPAKTTSLSIPNLDVGNYMVLIAYPGDNNFIIAQNSTIFTVHPLISRTNVSVDNSTGKAIIKINVTDLEDKPVNGSARIVINGSNGYHTSFFIDIINSHGNITIEGLSLGNYTVKATFSSINYNQSYDACSFEIISTISGFNLTSEDVIKEFENDTQYHVRVTDSYGNPLANMFVYLSINSSKWTTSVNYTVKTNEDGIATLIINLLPGDYKVTAHFADKTTNNKITVLSVNYSLKANDVVKYFKNSTQYTVKVTDVNGNPVINRTVTVYVNRNNWKNPVKYFIKTNEDGIARLTINLIAGSYSITSNICYNSTKNTIKVLPILTVNNLVKKLSVSGSLKAKLVDGQGNPAQGKEVTFTVKDKIYTVITDSNGIAILPIHLHVGNWSVLIVNPETEAYTWATIKVIK